MKPVRTYEVAVTGFSPGKYSARSPGKARARAWSEYASTFNNTSFADFMKISRVCRVEDPPGCGERIVVNGETVTRVYHGRWVGLFHARRQRSGAEFASIRRFSSFRRKARDMKSIGSQIKLAAKSRLDLSDDGDSFGIARRDPWQNEAPSNLSIWNDREADGLVGPPDFAHALVEEPNKLVGRYLRFRHLVSVLLTAGQSIAVKTVFVEGAAT